MVTQDICDTSVVNTHEQLLSLVKEITSKSGDECKEYSFQLFIVLLYVQALQQEAMFDKKV